MAAPRAVRRGRFAPALLAALVLPATLAAPAAAQQNPDFLFRQPKVTFGLRAGYALATAGSEVFDFTREQLTLDKSDFSGLAWQAEMAVRVTERVDVAFGIGRSSSESRSEFRDWVDEQNDLPIEQTTTFVRLPLTVSVKGYLRDRGRSVSRFAWIPYSWAPYVGGGVGWMFYEFSQTGDFVDFEDLSIFSDTFRSEGGTPSAHLLAGADVSLGPRFLLTGEARYTLASDEMSTDFVDFDAIDLSGFQASVGFAVRF